MRLLAKFITTAFTVSCLIIHSLPTSYAAVSSPPVISAKSAIVIEAATGKVLYSKNGEERRYPASTTKMMTLITALEHSNPGDIVTASANAADTEGSSLGLTQGEQQQMLDLLYGVMLVSGNDATVAVAEHISGSTDKFAALMTAKAHEIGAINTNFVNSSGLPDPNHYSTAHDLSKIAAYGYKNPLFAKIVDTRYKTIPWPGKDHARALYNENRILNMYEGGNGVKTGYTEAAGRCLVSAAKRDNIQLIAVVLDADTMWGDSMALLDYGFRQVKPAMLYQQGDIVKTVRVSNGRSASVPLALTENVIVSVSNNDDKEFRTMIDVPLSVEAPVASGQKIGSVHILYQETEFAMIDLVATETIERKTFFSMIWGAVWNFFTFIIKNFA